VSKLWVQINYMSTASLIRLLKIRHPDDNAVETLSKHFDKAVAEGDITKYICTRKGCPNKTDSNE